MLSLKKLDSNISRFLPLAHMKYRISICFILLLYVSKATFADEKVIKLQLNNKISATASYIQGETSKPTVLLIHGFLSTRNHATLKNLNLAIADEGYSTLAPTLSLDIDQRNQSLPCEAIHTHTMQTDVQEIESWVNWLHSQGHKKIILLGHSFGSLHMLVYLKKGNPAINYAIASSLIDLEHAIGTQKVNSQLNKARQAIKANNNTLQEYKISYCNKFVSTPRSFASYAEWNKEKILSLLSGIATPVHIIMGGSDKRMDKSWPSTLKKQGKKLSIIDSANHFFSNEFEFELHDKVLEILARQ